jgi:hypothetical protein
VSIRGRGGARAGVRVKATVWAEGRQRVGLVATPLRSLPHLRLPKSHPVLAREVVKLACEAREEHTMGGGRARRTPARERAQCASRAHDERPRLMRCQLARRHLLHANRQAEEDRVQLDRTRAKHAPLSRPQPSSVLGLRLGGRGGVSSSPQRLTCRQCLIEGEGGDGEQVSR